MAHVQRDGDQTREMERYYLEWWENPHDPRDAIFKGLNKLVNNRLPDGHGKKALDVGSGKGTIVEMLSQKGYDVTAVEINKRFTDGLRRKFPHATVIEGDFNSLPLRGYYDLVIAIEFVQNLNRDALVAFIKKVALVTDHIFLNISNKFSLHGVWSKVRGFQKPFVFTYSPSEIKKLLAANGFKPSYSGGVGFITPITLLADFKLKLVPPWLARGINVIADPLFPRACHLYYIEAEKKPSEEVT